MTSAINKFKSVVSSPRKVIEQWKDEHKALVIGCAPYYAPQEIIHAAGILPVGIWGGQVEIEQANTHIQVFACSIVRAVLELRLKNVYKMLDGFVFNSTCDHIQALSDIWKVAFADDNVFDLMYPINKNSSGVFAYLLSLFQEFKAWLEDIARKRITHGALHQAIGIYNKKRGLLRRLAGMRAVRPGILSSAEASVVLKAGLFLPVEEYVDLLELLLAELEQEQPAVSGPRIIITGIMAEPVGVLDLLDKLGAVVVGDDLLLGERLYRDDVDENGEPLAALANHFLGLEPCAVIYGPAKPRGKSLIKQVQKTNADGVLVINMKYCEMEEFDYPYIKEDLTEASIPHLWIEVEQQGTSFEQYRTRLQAFIEMLKARKEHGSCVR
jgi:bcr-type benzoyl-CoA reductase subunit C